MFAADSHSAGPGHGCPITVITSFPPTYSKLFPPPDLLSPEVGRRECLSPVSLFISHVTMFISSADGPGPLGLLMPGHGSHHHMSLSLRCRLATDTPATVRFSPVRALESPSITALWETRPTLCSLEAFSYNSDGFRGLY